MMKILMAAYLPLLAIVCSGSIPVVTFAAQSGQHHDRAEFLAQAGRSISGSAFGAKPGRGCAGEVLSLTEAENGASIHCAFQGLEGRVTTEGLWLTSTTEDSKSDRFRVVARAWGRAQADLRPLAGTGTIEVDGDLIRFVRPKITEEYSVGTNGVRQDFVVARRPSGTGELRVELEVIGARAEQTVTEARLVLDKSGRHITYGQLRVEDARGRLISARIEVFSEHRIIVSVDDSDAIYPVRIDPTYTDADWVSFGGPRGSYREPYAVVGDSAGNIYIGGEFTIIGDSVVNYIAKWDGSNWSNLGAGMNGTVYALKFDAAGNLYAAGNFSTAGGVNANRVAKWNGTAWSAVGSGMNDGVVSLAFDSLGNLYAGGYFTTAGGINANRIAKWNGSNWSALGVGMNSYVKALAVDSVGNLYAGGAFGAAGAANVLFIAKWNGSTWSALGSGMNHHVEALSFDSAGNLYAGGWFTTAGGLSANRVAKWNGSNWSSLGSGLNDIVRSVGFDNAGNFYAAGDFISAGGVSANRVAKWNGTSWSPLAAGLDSVVSLPTLASRAFAIAFDSAGNLFAGGEFATAGSIVANRIAKWDGSTWSALANDGSGLSRPVQAPLVFDSTGNLYAAGNFTSAGNVSANRIAKWNGTMWTPLANGINEQVFTLAIDGADNIYAGGFFTMAGGVNVNNIAKWNGSTWSPLGSGLNFSVSALVFDSAGNLYAGGDFTVAGGVGANRIARWNGTDWTPLGDGLNGSVRRLVFDTAGNLYAGGFFTKAGGVSANRIAKWNGTTWSPLGSGFNGGVMDLVFDNSGNLYAGGPFTTAGGINALYVAKWNGSNWSPLKYINGTINTLLTDGLGNLYAGGSFTDVLGPTVNIKANNIAKWDGSNWSTFGSGMNAQVVALALNSVGHLYAGGQFTTAGGKAAGFLAKIDLKLANHPPSFVKGTDPVVLEDAGPQTIVNWATSINHGSPDEIDQILTFNVGNDNPGLFSVQPVISSSGTLTFRSATNLYGSATVSVVLNDNGGMLYGGSDTSSVQTFSITVLPVNEPPTLNALTDQTVLSEGSSYVRNLSGIGAGPAEELQSLTFTAISSNPGLIPAPVVDYTSPNSTGTLTFTPVANAKGTAVITVTLQDSGGVANGGVDTISRSFTVTVRLPEEAPLANPDAYTVNEDTGLSVLPQAGLLANDNRAPEATLQLELLTNPAGNLWLNSLGQFAYLPPRDFFGNDSYTYRVRDGTLVSPPGTVTITVLPVNDPPQANEDRYITEPCAVLAVPAPGVLANDSDVDNATITAALVSDAAHGHVTLNADGSFNYVPFSNYHGEDYFIYQAMDQETNSIPVTVWIWRDRNIIVESTADSGPGSLRQAILDANECAANIVVTASVTNSVITLLTPLPALTNGGTAVYAPFLAMLSGPGSTNGGAALRISSANNVIWGIGVHGFETGIEISGPSATNNLVVQATISNTITGLKITEGAFSNSVFNSSFSGNSTGALMASNAFGNLLFGSSINENSTGVMIAAASGNIITHSSFDSNTGDGVLITTGSSNFVGRMNGDFPWQGGGAAFFYNGRNGVRIENGVANTVRNAYFQANGAPPVDLGGDGATDNDPLDVDVGPNNLQNFPTILFARQQDQVIFGHGVLNSLPNTEFLVEGFLNVVGVDAAFSPIGLWQVHTDENGKSLFDFAFPSLYSDPFLITQTATDPAGNTSEIGPGTAFFNDDDGDGIQNEIDGHIVVDGGGNNIFVDEKTQPSNNFIDQHLGGATSGVILDRNGLVVGVQRGSATNIVIGAAGPTGSGPASIFTCDENITIENGTSVSVVQGSLKAAVRIGEIRVTLPTGTAIVPQGTSVHIKNFLDGTIHYIENEASSTDIVTIESGENAVELPPGRVSIDGIDEYVGIDIKPDSLANTINLKADGTITVAILGSRSFDVRRVNPATVSLERASVILLKNGKPMASLEDVNRDGILDLLVHVRTAAMELRAGESQATLFAGTFDNRLVGGIDSIRTVP